MEEVLSRLNAVIENIDSFCAPSHDNASDLLSLLKLMFELSGQLTNRQFGSLTELIVDQMDAQSVWEQIQVRNRPLNRYIESSIRRLKEAHVDSMTSKTAVSDDHTTEDDGSDEYSTVDSDEDVDQESEEDDDDEEDEDDEIMEADDNDMEESSDENEDNENDDDEAELEMENWLDEVETKEERRRMKEAKANEGHKGSVEEDDYDDDEEDDEAFVERELYDLSSGEEDEDDPKYNDFFGSDSQASDEEEEDESEEEVEDESDEGSEGDVEGEPLTPHQRKKQRIQDQIKALEEASVAPKPWDLKGEVKSSDRPENSLLGLPVSVERASKPVPVITQEYSKTIEDMIIERIKASRFDNIVPVSEDAPKRDTELPELSQEKDRKGLGEMYAEQFVKQTLQYDKNEKQRSEAVSALYAQFKKVCSQLDALSHFHFAPKPTVSEMAVSSVAVATPSISMEDALPMAQGGGQSTLAPEQVYEKKRGRSAAFIAPEEADRDDRQRLRRANKATRRRERKLEKQNNPTEDRGPIKDSRVTTAAPGSASDKKSTFSQSATFFSHLQDTVNKGIASQKKTMKSQSEEDKKKLKSNTLKL
mmetsp:Transcript_3812/g.5926  ORF Transcript_3812/g.5926 Transcript_3812/m.5926 type:complete len:591 (+) Transcript_3812:29-1801(+)